MGCPELVGALPDQPFLKADPNMSLQAALDEASGAEVIVLHSGMYTMDRYIRVTKPVQLVGCSDPFCSCNSHDWPTVEALEVEVRCRGVRLANLAIKCPIKISIADEDEFAFPWAHKFYCMVESCLLSDVVVVCGDASLVPRAHGDFPVKLASNDVRGSVRILNPVRGTSVSLRNNLVTNAWPYRAAVSVCSIPSRRTLCGMQPCSGRGPSGPCTCPCGEVEVTGNSISGVDLGMFITCPSHLTVARNTFSGCSRPVSCGRCKNCVMHHFQKLFCSSDGSAHGAYQCELLYQ